MPTRRTKATVSRGGGNAVEINAALLSRLPLPKLDERGDKEARGRVLVFAGSDEMPGATLLAGTGALRAGAGKLQIATPVFDAEMIMAHLPEARFFRLSGSGGVIDPHGVKRIAQHVSKARAVLVGPGMADEKDPTLMLKSLFSFRRDGMIFILDANALNALASKPNLLAGSQIPAILTPHATELSQITGEAMREIVRDPLAAAQRASRKFRAVVALKGRETFVAAPHSSEIYVNRAGNFGLATSGSGDVLAGVIAGLAARGADPLTAAVWGVHAHALAGERLAKRIGRVGYLARELLDEIPPVLDKLEAN
jgi:hydroxyethylthiazole kinase-like uncharacterized protein yjeF